MALTPIMTVEIERWLRNLCTSSTCSAPAASAPKIVLSKVQGKPPLSSLPSTDQKRMVQLRMWTRCFAKTAGKEAQRTLGREPKHNEEDVDGVSATNAAARPTKTKTVRRKTAPLLPSYPSEPHSVPDYVSSPDPPPRTYQPSPGARAVSHSPSPEAVSDSKEQDLSLHGVLPPPAPETSKRNMAWTPRAPEDKNGPTTPLIDDPPPMVILDSTKSHTRKEERHATRRYIHATDEVYLQKWNSGRVSAKVSKDSRMCLADCPLSSTQHP
ncbi:hypothetical protein BU26DRAFT_545613 [Trematosphaeria pertusa]|uniref:Uncharacterized protein n=1 Tax=Trematosphaeria pertusa TaxID=390896 RepID=A0A6A6J207_9PLEO|nr:uncharacterized protein BU26DRAFT_545613 [Trematosphaeria pertusa]KAF2256232.1 hypothetical protein BU26DRAFT_545613 [Trematosphaeria pertusa]